ncbi:hypothetical protein LP316_09865 [Thalassotalea sp. LPB0316]|uniref:hypothetical protein n=1 Tax=Thalassotalea sp. LPB0316 TaxID=2769490 RepID=UPI0018677BCA|nr:hypothetical protein [Thalassotalea sp. LPB0316]QOL24650.1 hypothetical protein LP316_09865 [Thalassotalea sp. LPB0316]
MNSKLYNCHWGFKCDKTWESLTNTDDPKVKYCTNCKRNVHKIENEAELHYQINLNRCLYFSGLFVDHKKDYKYPVDSNISDQMYVGEVRADYVIAPKKD